jgi:hypothetical protein
MGVVGGQAEGCAEGVWPEGETSVETPPGQQSRPFPHLQMQPQWHFQGQPQVQKQGRGAPQQAMMQQTQQRQKEQVQADPSMGKSLIDPRYRDLTCYNCGEPDHFIGICSK